MSWSPPTYKSVMELAGNPSVRCEGCGRTVSADMLLDARMVPAKVWPHDYACDGCASRLFATGAIARAEFFGYLGAPTELIERLGGTP